MLRNAIITIAVFFIAVLSCKTATERSTAFQTGVNGGKVAYRMLSVAMVLQHFTLPYDAAYLPKHTAVLWIDSTLSDGNGFLFRVDFGKGTVCRDGMTRKGSCTIELNDTSHSYQTSGKLQAIASDSFGVLTSAGWEYCYGYFRILALNADSAHLHCNLNFTDKNQNFNLRMDSSNLLTYERDANFNHYKTGYTWTGFATIISPGSVLSIVGPSFHKKPECMGSWNSGKATVQNEAGEKWELDMNAFGNEQCDQVFKVSRKQKTGLLEDVFNAW